MRSRVYLALPLVATVLDLLWACFLFHHHQAVADLPGVQEIPATAEAVELPDLCIGDAPVCNNDAAVSDADAVTWKQVQDDDEEEDPQLMSMPDYPEFKAYVRKDISSMYQEKPGSRKEKTPKFNGQAGKFVNMSPERLSLYW